MNKEKLNNLCLNITDGTHSTVIDDDQGSYCLLSCKNVKNGHIIIDNNDRRINKNTLESLRKRTKMEYGDVVLTTVGTIGESSCILDKQPKYEFQRSVAILKPNNELILSKYLNYFFTSTMGQIAINSRIKGAAQPCLFLNDIKDIDITVPTLDMQQHIVNTIGTIDDLIEKNTKIIDKLHKFSDLIYHEYLMNDLNNGVVKLGDFCEIKTGKLNAEASCKNGKYPFFTCGKDELLIDDYAFNCKAIIIAGNGEISCKYYDGKFNAYQRTYVLSPNKYFFLFQKACEFGINDLVINSQGSVIKFITKGMLEAISIPLNNEAIITNQKLALLYNLMFKYKKKNNKLKQVKQNLLSKYF